MQEVFVAISSKLYNTNQSFVTGLENNLIKVIEINAPPKRNQNETIDEHKKRMQDHYEKIYNSLTNEHYNLLCDKSPRAKAVRRNFLCVTFESSLEGIKVAKDLNMTVFGISSDSVESKRFIAAGAHCVKNTISDVFKKFKMEDYYQIAYLPYVNHLAYIADRKSGYPVSLFDMLRGKFTDNGLFIDKHEERIIHRAVLGVRPRSLADTYINNVGWPQDKLDNFRLNTRSLERDIIRIIGKYYGLPENAAQGYVTSGGTEGNFCAFWWARDYLLHNRIKELTQTEEKKDISELMKFQLTPVLILSDAAHYSVRKACQQLALKALVINTGKNGEMDCTDLSTKLSKELKSKLESKEVIPNYIVNVTIGTTETGAIDNLPEIYKTLEKFLEPRSIEYSIHLDAALTGAVLPLLKKPFGKPLEKNLNVFQFGVKTIAISGHKFFGSNTICGVCLTNKAYLSKVDEAHKESSKVSYITGLHDITPSGSRSGFHVLSFHNTLLGLDMHTNQERLRKSLNTCQENIEYFIKKLKTLIKKDYILNPNSSFSVGFPKILTSSGNSKVWDELRSRYSLMPIKWKPKGKELEYATMCVLPNISVRLIDEFFGEYSGLLEASNQKATWRLLPTTSQSSNPSSFFPEVKKEALDDSKGENNTYTEQTPSTSP